MGTSLKFPIINLNLKKVEQDGISFCGLEGCVKYKKHSTGYTQEEALKLDIPKANILFSHETADIAPCCEDDFIHVGYKAVSRYLKKHKPKYHIFGHHHQDLSFQIGKTQCFCIFGCSFFDSEKGEIKKIF